MPNGGVRLNIEVILTRVMIGLATLVLAGVASWANTIEGQLRTHVGRRVHSGAALRETADKLDENQRLLWHEINVNREILRLDVEHPTLMAARPIVRVPARTD